jgi:hypothetical protein
MMVQRQHTVPACLLTGFAVRGRKLIAWDRVQQKSYGISVNNATVVSGIHDVPDGLGIERDSIEDLMADVESRAGPALAKVRSGGMLTPEIVRALVDLIALQRVRSLEQWAFAAELADYERELTAEMPDEVRPPSLGRETILAVMLSGYEVMRRALVERGLRPSVVTLPKKHFITSDNPVVLVGDSLDGSLGPLEADDI